MQNRDKLNKLSKSKSKYKGVRLFEHKNGNILWQAVAQKDNIKHYLGYFKTEEEAAEAYNNKIKETYNCYASLNIIKKQLVNFYQLICIIYNTIYLFNC